MNYELRSALDRVALRLRRRSLWANLAFCWLAWGGAGLALLATGPYPSGLVAILGGLALISGLGCALLARRTEKDPLCVAGRVEAAHPDLEAVLLTAVEDEFAPATQPRGFLRQSVLDRAIEHGRGHDWPKAVVSPWRLAAARFGHAAAGCGVLAVFGLLAVQSREFIDRSPPRSSAAASSAADAGLEVLPGDAEIERGTPLLVVARFGGVAPPEAKLVVEGGPGAGPPRGMTRSLEDPTFAGRVESVDADLTYHVEFGAGRSPSYRVHVFEHPELTRIDAQLVYPGYTALAPKTAEDVRHISAVEGTEAALTFRLNKEVASAALVDEDGVETPLEPTAAGAPTLRAALKLAESHRYKVRLVDRDGRKNKLTAELGVNVGRNRPPTIAVAAPGRDVRVSPVEELRLKAQADDDFGVVRHGLSYVHAGGEPREVVLSAADAGAKPAKKVEFESMIDFESLKAAPDELVSYFAWAEDVGPDGAVRRAEGDMFFAEVRHFEEIFRQGEPPPGTSQEQQQQEGAEAQQAEQLAELQKQVVNGTWKVVRREVGAKPTDKFAADVKLLQESQQTAVAQAEALGGKLQDPASKADLGRAVKAMGEAVAGLGAALAANDPAGLKPALAAEQAAYQALLKLRAREFQVVRGGARKRGGGGGGSASQRQLDQLELKNDEERFEEQSRAKPEEATQKEREQRETRQIASRLRELAQRQADLNARLKELQSALEAAKDETARQEVERQLKRLRDQQQQVLRDADELQERMENEQNRDRMAEARQQVEQAREHARQASDALEQGRTSQALTEGARAGEKLDQVREDLRKQSSNRFSEEMTEMRDEAKRLDEAQDGLTEKLDAWKDRPEKTLRDSGDRKDLEKGLERQREDFEKLVDRMKGTIQEAEETEPLLAKTLFDAVRKADEQAVPEALREAERLAQLGVPEEAARSSQRAGQGVDQLRKGVERAAQSILGDEVAALRRAQGEVDDLADQVDREIAQADGQGRKPGRPEGERRPGDPRQKARPGQAGDSERPDAEGSREGRPAGQGEPAEAGKAGDRRERQGEPQPKGQPGQPHEKGQPGAPQEKGQPGGGRGQPGELQEPGQGDAQKGQPGGQPGQGQQGQGGQGEPREPGRGEGGQGGEGAPQGGAGGGGGRSAGDRLLDGLARGPGAPIRGEGFRQWSDRMRDVEELLENPELRAEAARIRDRVRGAREEFKKHAKEPDWSQLKDMVAEPIRELRNRIAEEVRRREEPDALVPIDRDPVPPKFAEGVRRYYERLGSGR
ncbi:DUF4175 family protein [Paludisphaera mucosa]|uniref:Chromosome partition protein Smc n=1 Tax=Paludisphaera mucosa TaxID=3030827 RepID=A0ABT6FAD1_9BACT|nr:DUF4175 family protein [Paludisphaera mucosa]MDG3004348.1 hypothetical protein [Paludisphaera mucosa]